MKVLKVLEFRIRVPELDQLIQAARNGSAHLQEELEGAMERAVLIAEEEIGNRTPVDTGNLRARITSRVEGRGADVQGIVEVANVPYARWVEEGTRPHEIRARRGRALAFQAPAAFRLSDRRAQFRVQRGRRAGQLRVARSAETMIFVRRVWHPGTQGAHMFEFGAQAALPRIQRVFATALQRVVRRRDI